MAADQYSRLEKLVLEHDYVYMLLFNLIIRHDERLRKDVAEALQLLLQSQASGSSGTPRRTAAVASLAR